MSEATLLDTISGMSQDRMFIGRALDAVRSYEKLYDISDLDLATLSDSEIKRVSDGHNELRRFHKDLGDAVSAVGSAVNGYNEKKVAEAMFIALAKQHRTLQDSTISALIELFKIYQDAAFDMRNLGAVAKCRVIAEHAKRAGI